MRIIALLPIGLLLLAGATAAQAPQEFDMACVACHKQYRPQVHPRP